MKLIHKLYDINGNFSRTLSPTDVFSNIRIDQNINSWPSYYEYKLDKRYDSPINITEQILVVEYFNEANKSGRVVFKGVLEGITWLLWSNENTIVYKFWWIHRVVSKILQIAWPYNKSMSLITDDFVNWFNAKYPISWSLWPLLVNNITDTTVINKTWADLFTIIDWLNEMAKLTQWRFFIRPNGIVEWWLKPATPTHRRKVGVEIQSIQAEQSDQFDIINRVNANGYWFEDSTSVAIHWPREWKENFNTTHYPQIEYFANEFLAGNAQDTREIQIDVKLSDYSNVYPWQTVKLLNTRLQNVENLQIKKTSFDWISMKVYLEKYKWLWRVIKNI